MLELISKDIPAVYDIGVGEGDPCLLVKVQRNAMDYIEDILKKPKIPLVNSLKEELKLSLFIPPTKVV